MPSGAFLITNIMINIGKFLKETQFEMKHVVWPSRTKALVYALVVIIFSAALGYMLGAFDALFQSGLKQVLFK
jgi:preprotein translocase SecE subunit